MDYSLYRTINGLSGSSPADAVMRFVAEKFPAVLVAIVAMTFLWPWRGRRRDRQRGAVLGTAAAGVALLLNQPIARAVDRVRPYLAHPHHAHLLIARSHDPSFPSDHATGGFALALGVWLHDRLIGSVLLVLAALLAFARVYVGTHYPADIFGGALIGMAVALALRCSSARRLLDRVADTVSSLWLGLLQRVRRPVKATGR